jgi:dTDP-4-dehydrorhamnose 3,5-epimerase
MKILDIKYLEIPDIKVIRFGRFLDHRGYFTEQFRKSDIVNSGVESLKNVEFVQGNHSYSKKGVIRGMHFQWNPYMGKLIRTLSGNMTDLVLDIRKDSPSFGKAIGYEMPSSEERNYDEWIWVPPGFAHGNFFTEDSNIEYLCSGEYSQGCEAGISPLAKDIDWSLCNTGIRKVFNIIAEPPNLMTDKDKNGLSLEEWAKNEKSDNFIYSKLKELKLC